MGPWTLHGILRRAAPRSLVRGFAPLRRMTSTAIARQAAANLLANFVLLATTVGTGTILARTLGTTGRGNLAAVLVAPPLLAIVFGMGSNQATIYEQARDPSAYKWLISTWTLMLLPFIALGIALGELMMIILLRTQSGEVQHLAEFSIPALAFLVLGDLAMAVLVGDHKFTMYNRIRLAQGFAILLGYVVLAKLGRLNVATAVGVAFGVYIAVGLFTITVVLFRYGFGRPDWRKGRSSFWYGFRAHGTNVSQLANLRLDQLILPAFVAAESLGLYAVAVSVSSLVINLATPLAVLVLPIAARRAHDQVEVVRRATQASFAISAVVGLLLVAIAQPAITLVYGQGFVASVKLVDILLAGSIFYVAGFTLWQGLYAIGRPFSATIAQLAGLAATALGLFTLLPAGGGTTAAAIVSSVAYGTIMVASLLLYCHAAGLPLGSFLSLGSAKPPQSQDVGKSDGQR